ncbi:MAG: hypothetical protein A3J62_00755 [Candidatus Buchananbacteria bacterium RIFCSPHIGHO2_02_FULL_38_8]|uniref:Pseudouridine synthase n=1 Tax=Candidatus Buchananbacteria bacterium RIFCSPHIGHO2_02_FULL_38_8 TaxID=1797538 RepID=A0A1G1Y6G1_9BACT|nr:MAG: hypothetical protein A3J62_00755 [Candidatus Buchananbacteria bacterium RIFCSPHIGHO2_02_FULL_38_8]
MSKNIIIQQKNQGQRLDKFLNEKIKDKSRSQIKKMIKQGLVLVNGQPAKVHHFLKTGDEITFQQLSRRRDWPIAPSGDSYLIKTAPKIIFEDKNFLVIEKPIGLLVHPTGKNEKDTLVDWLVKQYPEIEKVGEQKYRAGIIHRLDRDVSGLMVVAKTNAAFTHLKEQFKNRMVKKEYLALVYGHLTQAAGEIDLPIGRNKKGQFVAHPRQGTDKFQAEDKIAKTKYQVVEYIKDYTLLKVQILTGRTHQIRVHLSALGHPILGDQIYRPKKKFFHFLRRKIKVVDPGRIFLHSSKIGFYNLNNQWVEFTSPLPKKLNDYLNEIRT